MKKAANKKLTALKKTINSKKPAVKTTDRKTTKKTAPTLIVAKGEYCFWTKDGQILKDLRDLEAAFKKMSPDVYSHHVTKDKNDFASWVESVLKDKNCSLDLRKAKKANTAKTVVTKHLKNYAK